MQKVTEKKIYEVIDSPFIGIHHIGIVSKYKKTIQDFIELIGYSLRNEGIIEEMGIKVSYFSGKNVKIEFVEPIKSENIIENFYKSIKPFIITMNPSLLLFFYIGDIVEAI